MLSNKGTAMTRLLSRVDYGRLIEQIPKFWTGLVSFGRIGEFSYKQDCFILLFERDCLLSNKGTAITRLLSRVDSGLLITSGQAYSPLEELRAFLLTRLIHLIVKERHFTF